MLYWTKIYNTNIKCHINCKRQVIVLLTVISLRPCEPFVIGAIGHLSIQRLAIRKKVKDDDRRYFC